MSCCWYTRTQQHTFLWITYAVCYSQDDKITINSFDKNLVKNLRSHRISCFTYVNENRPKMKFEQFVLCTFASILMILSCAEQYQCISHDSSVGFCSNVTRTNSVPLVSKVIHKPNNKFMKFFRKTEITIRFPEVTVFLFCFCYTKNRTTFQAEQI